MPSQPSVWRAALCPGAHAAGLAVRSGALGVCLRRVPRAYRRAAAVVSGGSRSSPRLQFPWRLMIVVEFAAITALCLTPWRRRSRAALLAMGVGRFLFWLQALASWGWGFFVAYQRQHDPARQAAGSQAVHAGRLFPSAPERAYAELGLEPLKGTCRRLPVPPAATVVQRPRTNASALCASRSKNDMPTTVVLRRFFFPAWRIDKPGRRADCDCAEPIRLKLVSFRGAPPGRHSFHLRRTALALGTMGLGFCRPCHLFCSWCGRPWSGV